MSESPNIPDDDAIRAAAASPDESGDRDRKGTAPGRNRVRKLIQTLLLTATAIAGVGGGIYTLSRPDKGGLTERVPSRDETARMAPPATAPSSPPLPTKVARGTGLPSTPTKAPPVAARPPVVPAPTQQLPAQPAPVKAPPPPVTVARPPVAPVRPQPAAAPAPKPQPTPAPAKTHTPVAAAHPPGAVPRPAPNRPAEGTVAPRPLPQQPKIECRTRAISPHFTVGCAPQTNGLSPGEIIRSIEILQWTSATPPVAKLQITTNRRVFYVLAPLSREPGGYSPARIAP